MTRYLVDRVFILARLVQFHTRYVQLTTLRCYTEQCTCQYCIASWWRKCIPQTEWRHHQIPICSFQAVTIMLRNNLQQTLEALARQRRVLHDRLVLHRNTLFSTCPACVFSTKIVKRVSAILMLTRHDLSTLRQDACRSNGICSLSSVQHNDFKTVAPYLSKKNPRSNAWRRSQDQWTCYSAASSSVCEGCEHQSQWQRMKHLTDKLIDSQTRSRC